MRIVAFALSVALGLVSLVTVTDALPDLGVTGASVVPFLVAVVALWAVGLFSGIVSAGSLREPGTAEGRRAARRVRGAGGAVVLAAALLVIVPAVSGGVPTGLAAATLAVAAVYIAATSVVGRALRARSDRRRVGPFPIPPLDPDYSRRHAYSTTIVASSVLVAGVLFAFAAGRPSAETSAETAAAAAIAVAFAAITASVMCAIPTVTLSGRVRDLSGRDAARLKRIRHVVIGGKPVALSTEEADIAARYAPYAAQSQRWSLAQSLTLFVGLLAINDPSVDRPLQIVIWVVLPLTAAIALPLGLRAARRAERYALEHRPVPAASFVEDAAHSPR